MSTVTQLLQAIGAGETHAAAQLIPLVYDELRRVAAAQMAREKPGQTLDATALVHEVWLRLAAPNGSDPGSPEFANRRHFFAAAAEAMRRILVENARRKKRIRHGGKMRRVDLSDAEPARNARTDELLAVDEVLDQLAVEDQAAAEIVKLRFFGGFSIEEAADALGLSRSAAYRHWTYARAWLALRIRGESE